jgi:hypothetical protein
MLPACTPCLAVELELSALIAMGGGVCPSRSLPRRGRETIRSWLCAALIRRDIAVIDPLLVRPFLAEPFFARQRPISGRRGHVCPRGTTIMLRLGLIRHGWRKRHNDEHQHGNKRNSEGETHAASPTWCLKDRDCSQFFARALRFLLMNCRRMRQAACHSCEQAGPFSFSRNSIECNEAFLLWTRHPGSCL